MGGRWVGSTGGARKGKGGAPHLNSGSLSVLYRCCPLPPCTQRHSAAAAADRCKPCHQFRCLRQPYKQTSSVALRLPAAVGIPAGPTCSTTTPWSSRGNPLSSLNLCMTQVRMPPCSSPRDTLRGRRRAGDGRNGGWAPGCDGAAGGRLVERSVLQPGASPAAARQPCELEARFGGGGGRHRTSDWGPGDTRLLHRLPS